MLKIKDYVDLKDLEKYDFADAGEKLSRVAMCFSLEPLFIIVDKNTKEIICRDLKTNKRYDALNYIQDLIQAGLVEKLGE